MPRTFLPWVRPTLKELAKETRDSTLPAAARVTVRVTVNETDPISKHMRLDGPGDVIGLDPGQIRRTDPAPGTMNFETNYFPLVEFARPDLPWLFTPAAANDQDQLRPWVVLVAVRKQPGVSLLLSEGHLPVLEIKGDGVKAADELPDLDDSWAWAHAQVNGPLPPEGLGALFASAPHLVCSRLLCPQPLKPNAGYYACVVPAFEAGRVAGLGDDPNEDARLEPAWTKTSKSIRLPVYHVWEFATGPDGDFESLVQLLLEPKPDAGETLAPRMVDASDAGPDLPKPASSKHQSSFGLECPLLPTGSSSVWEGKFAASLAAGLQDKLAPRTRRSDPQLTPPVYGSGYVSGTAGALTPKAPPWLRDLNLEPRYRLAAAFGAEVVRRHQDRLVDSAWDQAGAIREANRLINQTQAAAVASQAMIRRHLVLVPDAQIVELTHALHATLQIEGQSFRSMVAASSLTASLSAGPPATPAADATSPEFSRIARTRGPIFRRVAAPVARRGRAFLDGVRAGAFRFDTVRQVPSAATPESVEQLFASSGHARPPGTASMSFGLIHSTQTSSPPPSFAITSPNLPQPPGTPLAGMVFGFAVMTTGVTDAGKRFAEALAAHQPRLASANAPPAPTGLDVNLAAILRANLAPMRLFKLALADRVQLTGGPAAPASASPASTDGDDQVITEQRTAPEFPEPLYAALGAISPDLVVQGFETIGNNTITALETNPRFVEAFMAGANHEMTRELAWREFPLSEQATFFRTFWESSTRAAQSDINPVQTWTAGHLGEHSAAGARAVFLLRGELIRRYPTAIVYLQKSKGDDPDGVPTMDAQRLQPTIRGSVARDAAFYGFEIDPDDLSAGNGWIVVIEEPLTEPRFGRNADGSVPEIKPGADAAKTAKVSMQVPFRFAVHVRDLLRPHA